jgi:hypothetical protein
MYIMIAPDSKTEIGAPPPAGRVIDHHRHAVIRVHLEEFRRELVAAADVARDDLVIAPHSSSRMVTFLPFGVGQ